MASAHDYTEISLDPDEESVCLLLDDTCRWIAATRPLLPPELGDDSNTALEAHGWQCDARIAGGWVRDKLLNLPSEDMDVCLSSLTGFQFAHYVRLFLQSPDYLQTDFKTEPNATPDIGTITKIQANPEQGKNLETATAKIYGRSLDFVHLRPDPPPAPDEPMLFGTPHMDATRRDLTINALFYNVHTRRVEDYTGMGLDDLKHRVVRTPLDPTQTFLDDPLRILRSIRFACKYKLSLHDDLKACISGDQGEALRTALGCKIRRERLGTETDKMLRSPQPVDALQMIYDLDLWPIVFRPPPEKEDGTPSILLSSTNSVTPTQPKVSDETCLEMARSLEAQWHRTTPEESDVRNIILRDAEQRRRLFYAIALYPLTDLKAWTHPLPTKPGQQPKRTIVSAADVVMVDGLRLGVKVTKDPFDALYLSLQALLEFKEWEAKALERQVELRKIQTHFYMLLRQPCFTQPKMLVPPVPAFVFASLVQQHVPSPLQAEDLERWWNWIVSLGLRVRLEERPVLNGKQIQGIVGFALGRLFPTVQEVVLKWQLWNVNRDEASQPSQATISKATEWFHSTWNAGGIIPWDEVEKHQAAAEAKANKSRKKRKV